MALLSNHIQNGNDTALDRILRGEENAFALLYRAGSGSGPRGVAVEALALDVSTVATLAQLPLPAPTVPADGLPRHDLLVMIPYRQIAERGFAAADDGAPLLAMTVTDTTRIGIPELLARLPNLELNVSEKGFDISDEDYADLVRAVITDEIGRGTGANFVLRRSFAATVDDYSPQAALTVFRRLLTSEMSTYWTFLVHTGTRTFIGATPERHVSLADGKVVMNPISGTYRYGPLGPSVSGAMRFLADSKETDELYMVVDEELKMMAAVCEDGARIHGPYLKEMTQLAHTEYLLEGRSELDAPDILRATMFAPTVTGSPLQSAAEVIARYEPRGRGYYSGVLALIGLDARGRRSIDSSILIRTADIDDHGQVQVPVGATLVRHSDPVSEVAETATKAASVLHALRTGPTAAAGRSEARLADNPDVLRALERRNARLGRFWFETPARRSGTISSLSDLRVLVIDAEDTFTTMLGLQISSLGPDVAIRRFDQSYRLQGADLVVVGPGPGDPTDGEDPKIAALRALTIQLLSENRLFLSVCLGHQVLSGALGLPLIRKRVPHQGMSRDIDLFGRRQRVGFYNTFTATLPFNAAGLPHGLRISRDPDSGEVHALQGKGFRSFQFHPESILTENGVDILQESLVSLLAADASGARSA